MNRPSERGPVGTAAARRRDRRTKPRTVEEGGRPARKGTNDRGTRPLRESAPSGGAGFPPAFPYGEAFPRSPDHGSLRDRRQAEGPAGLFPAWPPRRAPNPESLRIRRRTAGPAGVFPTRPPRRAPSAPAAGKRERRGANRHGLDHGPSRSSPVKRRVPDASEPRIPQAFHSGSAPTKLPLRFSGAASTTRRSALWPGEPPCSPLSIKPPPGRVGTMIQGAAIRSGRGADHRITARERSRNATRSNPQSHRAAKFTSRRRGRSPRIPNRDGGAESKHHPIQSATPPHDIPVPLALRARPRSSAESNRREGSESNHHPMQSTTPPCDILVPPARHARPRAPADSNRVEGAESKHHPIRRAAKLPPSRRRIRPRISRGFESRRGSGVGHHPLRPITPSRREIPFRRRAGRGAANGREIPSESPPPSAPVAARRGFREPSPITNASNRRSGGTKNSRSGPAIPKGREAS